YFNMGKRCKDGLCVFFLALPGILFFPIRVLLLGLTLWLLVVGLITNIWNNVKTVPKAMVCQMKAIGQYINESSSENNYSEGNEDNMRNITAMYMETLEQVIGVPKKAITKLLSTYKGVSIDISGMDFSISLFNITLSARDVDDYLNQVDTNNYILNPNVTGIDNFSTISNKLRDVFDETTYSNLNLIILIVSATVFAASIVIVFIQAYCYFKQWKERNQSSCCRNLASSLFIMKECQTIFQQSIMIGALFLVAFVLWEFDSVIYRTLEVIRMEANLTTLIEGGSGFQVVLNDTSPRIRDLLHQKVPFLFTRNSTTFDYSFEIKTEPCLPVPLPPFKEGTRFVFLIVLFCAILILTLLTPFRRIFQSCICRVATAKRNNDDYQEAPQAESNV
ncbi:unnamed protein product, partial [Owenia fusiformis]